jgi:hypothetical protein
VLPLCHPARFETVDLLILIDNLMYANVTPILNTVDAVVFVPCSIVQFRQNGGLFAGVLCDLLMLIVIPRALHRLYQTAHSFEPIFCFQNMAAGQQMCDRGFPDQNAWLNWLSALVSQILNLWFVTQLLINSLFVSVTFFFLSSIPSFLFPSFLFI